MFVEGSLISMKCMHCALWNEKNPCVAYYMELGEYPVPGDIT
jgi:hypothetical protein